MPLNEKLQPVSIRLYPHQLAHLKRLAREAAFRADAEFTAADLIRYAIGDVFGDVTTHEVDALQKERAYCAAVHKRFWDNEGRGPIPQDILKGEAPSGEVNPVSIDETFHNLGESE